MTTLKHCMDDLIRFKDCDLAIYITPYDGNPQLSSTINGTGIMNNFWISTGDSFKDIVAHVGCAPILLFKGKDNKIYPANEVFE